ncbi:hypothetical protein BGZ65_009363 [Modicella reniformis]|uniref:Uncharacterized protein n=1 Tax=Modicella reniformis TaxID=1440133 RepID=A0A9P6JJB9_9FUNG|nr:hypothetical protein BGZ65_009363 [Modicella reniformis]
MTPFVRMYSHQPLMLKKMQRLEASTEFRPFKFRIQAFTNAFHDALIGNGLTEDILPLRKVKVYLWKHRYISRFNEDGKKQKSKGNHVWNIEARKIHHPTPAQTPQGSGISNGGSGSHDNISNELRRPSSAIRWEFREYSSRIAGQIIKFARVGVLYVYSPRIWDAQMSCPTAKFSSPWLPPWLKWQNSELMGTPGPEDESCTITVVAEYVREGEDCCLEMSFPLTVSDPAKEGELMDSQNEHEDEDELEEEEYDDKEQQQHQQQQQQQHHPLQQQDSERNMSTDSGGLQQQQQQQWQQNRHPHHDQLGHQNQIQSQSQSQSQHQAQRQFQHLQLQERPRRMEDDISDDPQEMDEDDDMEEDGGDEEKLHIRKQSRERRSLLLTQETKRRKHD